MHVDHFHPGSKTSFEALTLFNFTTSTRAFGGVFTSSASEKFFANKLLILFSMFAYVSESNGGRAGN
jgi:hypothetical protein